MSNVKEIKMKKLGVIGGLGPMATAYFYQLVVRMTDASKDQEHINTVIISDPSTPDRTRFILGMSNEDPMPFLMESGRELVKQGVDVIAVPCITAHFFQHTLQDGLGVEVINAIEETGRYLQKKGIDTIGVIATDGTIETGLFQKTLLNYGIKCFVPDKNGQETVMHLIYDEIKAGKTAEIDLFNRVADQLFEKGAQIILLGCTEISLIKKENKLGKGFLDVMEVLAQKAVLTCGRLREEYKELITE